jgi:hypothetical protein
MSGLPLEMQAEILRLGTQEKLSASAIAARLELPDECVERVLEYVSADLIDRVRLLREEFQPYCCLYPARDQPRTRAKSRPDEVQVKTRKPRRAPRPRQGKP